MKPIKEALSDLKNNNIENISKELLNNIQPYVLMRWLYGTYNAKQILSLNNIVNTTLSKNYKHPLLSFYLMSTITTDSSCKWIKPLKKTGSNKKELLIVAEYYKCSLNKARDYLKIISNSELEEIKDELGIN